MKFTVTREALLKPLQLVTGVVERRHTLPVLSNVLMVVEGDRLSLTGTDLEVELIGRVNLQQGAEDGEITVPARKLMDICKSLPDDAIIEFKQDDLRVIVKAGRSRFTLSTLPAAEFPSIDEDPGSISFSADKHMLRSLIDNTGFAMAQQDVRYYLNGLLLELTDEHVRTVATDGHRLAMCTSNLQREESATDRLQVIVPRKGILEFARILTDGAETVDILLGSNHMRAVTGDYTFTSKLVDGKFPEYERVLPRGGDKEVIADRQLLRQALNRAAILSNEKYRGVRLTFAPNQLTIIANNPEQEEAQEELPVDYQGETLEIGFNVSYLLDVLSVISGKSVKITLSGPDRSALVEDSEGGESLYVVMPMRL
ncbi:DNA polymerase III subunit beta [Zooshikella marina]|uniref:DNA polymerase III subunit beta n=1 Tax=Zooshikella ganghwensis TaxID=202772 RepID=UPI0003F4FE82|nr:DNA polymerase III subunit beta [Zooshikella ganghwensis]MBU2705960.1 DNA polymerase III subunit beta [Zooshikella ganghwensis]